MDIDKYFIKDKQKGAEAIMNIFLELNNDVRKYIKDKNDPILNGKIELYKNILDQKHLSKSGNEISYVLKEFSKMFQRAVIWENAGTMINITPPANIVSIATSFYASLFNPNFAQDESSGYLMSTELLVSKYLSELVGWDSKISRGIFTFGGKGTNLYAVKVGLKKALPDSIDNGLQNNDIVVISNEKSHPCHMEVCDWLGLGKKACFKIPVNKNGQVELNVLEDTLRSAIEENKVIACIIVNGGTTNEIIIDPIKEVVDLRDRLVKEYNLNYIPHIHVDAVIGWAWLFFKYYDFDKNPLKMNESELRKIKSMKNKILQIKYADSFGADFHKTGFCPYISSIYMAKNFNEVMALGNKKDKGIDSLKFGEYSPFEYTLELTRSSIGPVSAYAALEVFGIDGFQRLIYNIFSNGEYIRNYLNQQDDFEVINMETEGIATLFIVIPENDKKTYNEYLNESMICRQKFLDYNHQFYLFCLQKLEKKEIHFKITFSKSYNPYGSKIATGALKIYPISPIATKENIKLCLDELVRLKEEFNEFTDKLTEDREIPIDYVYRD